MFDDSLGFGSYTPKFSFLKPKPVPVEPEFAIEGEVCGGFDETTGGPFPDCAYGLLCIESGGISIPGAGNYCVSEREA